MDMTFSWSLNGTPINSTSPYSMEFDGLNAVLINSKHSDKVYGEYTLLLKGTSTHDIFVFLPCENLAKHIVDVNKAFRIYQRNC